MQLTLVTSKKGVVSQVINAATLRIKIKAEHPDYSSNDVNDRVRAMLREGTGGSIDAANRFVRENGGHLHSAKMSSPLRDGSVNFTVTYKAPATLPALIEAKERDLTALRAKLAEQAEKQDAIEA